MIISVHLYIIKKILRDQWALVVSLFVFILLCVIVFIFYARFNKQKAEVELLTNKVQLLKERYDTLKYNTSLSQDQIKEYNALLTHLIPEAEDYFSIIYALEKISSVSQLAITDYTVNVSKTDREQLTLTVDGKGDPESFLTFLEEYQFAGGRLVTSDKIQYGGGVAGNVRIALSFYSKRFIPNESTTASRLSEKEIAKLETIKQKVKFEFSAGDSSSVSTDYSTKTNPFN